MNIPHTISLGCFILRVEIVENLADGGEVCDGLFDPDTMTIKLRVGLNETQLLCALWHEIKHLCTWFVGADENGLEEEQIVGRVEKAEVSVLIQNPALREAFDSFKQA